MSNIIAASWFWIAGGDEQKSLIKDSRSANTQLKFAYKSINPLIEEQDEYITEIEDFQDEMKYMQEKYEAELKKDTNRFWKLKDKELSGTITEEEQEELFSLEQEMNDLTENNKAEIEKNNNSLNSVKQNYTANNKIIDLAFGSINNASEVCDKLNEWNTEYNSTKKIYVNSRDFNDELSNNLNNGISHVQDNISEYCSKTYYIKK